MNELQRRLLNIVQGRFPLEATPFAALAEELGNTEAEIIEQIKQLKQTGIIRRIGPIFDAAGLGYVSTLVAAQVPADRLEAFIADVNALPGVSHNYGRAHKFNVWFTLTMASQKSIDQTLGQLRQDHDLPAIYSLPAEKLFKIKVHFDFVNQETKEAADGPAPCKQPAVTEELSNFQIDLIRRLQGDLPLVSDPFGAIADEIDADVDHVLGQIRTWQETGVIRRFGAGIRHHNAGFKANGMVVFEVPREAIDTAGAKLARLGPVSHCYQRPSAPDWPYNLFAMTHCRFHEELAEIVAAMVAQVKPIQYEVVMSTAEYKKTNVKYFME